MGDEIESDFRSVGLDEFERAFCNAFGCVNVGLFSSRSQYEWL